MTHPLPHEHVSTLLGLYALGAAEPEDARSVEQHAARCSECHAELQQMLAAADSLAFAPAQHPAPARLHDNVMASIGAHRATRNEEASKQSRRAELRHRVTRIWVNRQVVVPMAACLLLALSVATVQTVRLSNQPSQAPATTTPVAASSSMFATSHVFSVDTSGALKGSKMELVDVHGAGMLVTQSLPDPPIGYEWRVWGVSKDHVMHAMGELKRSTEEMGIQPIAGLHSQPFDAVAVTLEAVGASTVQTGPVVGWAQMT